MAVTLQPMTTNLYQGQYVHCVLFYINIIDELASRGNHCQRYFNVDSDKRLMGVAMNAMNIKTI